jgi:hypothetical protein
VQLIVEHAINPKEYLTIFLYDGQTKEILAYGKIEKGNRNGAVFDSQHKATSSTNAGWDDAKQYIDQMMAEDRK